MLKMASSTWLSNVVFVHEFVIVLLALNGQLSTVER